MWRGAVACSFCKDAHVFFSFCKWCSSMTSLQIRRAFKIREKVSTVFHRFSTDFSEDNFNLRFFHPKLNNFEHPNYERQCTGTWGWVYFSVSTLLCCICNKDDMSCSRVRLRRHDVS